MDDGSISISSSQLQSMVLSAPCLFKETTSRLRRSFSSPSLASGLVKLRVDVQDHDEYRLENAYQSDDLGEEPQDARLDTREVCLEDQVDTQSSTSSVGDSSNVAAANCCTAEVLQDGFSEGQKPLDAWSVSTSDRGVVHQAEPTAPWTDVLSFWGSVSPCSSTGGTKNVLLSGSSESSKNNPSEGSEHSSFFASTEGIPMGFQGDCNDGVTNPTCSFWKDNPVNLGSEEGLEHLQGCGELCLTPPGSFYENSEDQKVVEPAEQILARRALQECCVVVEHSTVSLMGSSSPIVDADEAKGDGDCAKELMKTSKTTCKLIPRLFKGKRN
ncbi:uncharacterized protein LOC135400153 [Ornithodoros turicata]|uniref:uncharacterized protein LOC135400153 n=1 Tax=Ornithodoros turicata TaxID=34597 RepID=UPI0031387D63